MNIESIIERASDPQPYDSGTAVMWTDAYISKQLLAAHIDGSNDIASRSEARIDKTVQWICEKLDDCAKVLDLGCGPGLYTQRIAQAGHDVTGVDFSAQSIAYAKAQAADAGLDIEYICADYLKADIGGGYDMAIMIYCDFGVLTPDARQTLLRKVHRALKPGGLFVLDALNEKAISRMDFSRSWEAAKSGFWRNAPYICLSQKMHFEAQKAILDQHIVIEEDGQCELYRFWNGYFNERDMQRIAQPEGFKVLHPEQILTDGGSYNDDGVTFFTLKNAEV